ncbi:hypothetical protein [Polynucleobacter necessarius]|uniref:hypothetical protein n=1 Tax=Polynucleobacter necessarius TaxID=576610 RepID=UPI0018D5628D|nr:hypothetical protein [Polynucleobacter necessarius]
MPMPTHAIASSDYIDALSDLILNSRLPVGLVALGMQTLPESNLADSCKEGLLRMRRLGVLLHFMNYTGDPEQLHWIQELEMEGIHFNMPQLRNQTLSHELFKNIRRSLYTQTQLYASKAGLVKDLENLSVWQIDHCYGSAMMAPISRHQMLHINDSRIAKAIFSLHHHQNLNQNGDK